MDIETNESTSILEQVKLQAQVLIPVLKALRAELGAPHANAPVAQARCGRAGDLYRKIGERTPGCPREKWAAMTAASTPRIGGDIDVQMLTMESSRSDTDAFDSISQTACRRTTVTQLVTRGIGLSSYAGGAHAPPISRR